MRPYRGKTEAGEWLEGYIAIGDKPFKVRMYGSKGYIDEVILSTVAQQTGLKDKNDKPIYGSIKINSEMSKGGDIVRGSYGIPPVMVTSKVIFEKGMFLIKTPDHKPEEINLHAAIECLDLEIIGNQTDNPELLEQEQERK